MTTTFQTSVNPYIAPGIEGGWASANPYYSLLQPGNGDLAGSPAPNVAWLVGATGAVVGRFAFADTANGDVTNANPGTGATQTATAAGSLRVGFVQRDQFALITQYLAGDTLALFQGQPITLISAGDVWCKFAAGATVGYFVFAKYADGTAVAVADTTAPTDTDSIGTTNASTTITAVDPTKVFPGMPISGTGIPTGAYVVSVNATALTAVISAAATATATITATVTTAVLTPWRVESPAGNNEIAKITVRG